MDNNWEHILERDALLSALVINPNDTESLVELAILLEDHFADYEGARQRYEQALVIDPYEEEALNHLGQLYEKRFSNYDKARELYETALVIDPADSRVNNNLGKLLEEQYKEYELAKTHYEKAIDSDPFFTNAYTNYGRLCRVHLSDSTKARQLLETALDINPDDPETLFQCAMVLDDAFEDYQAAREMYEKIIEIDPTDDVIYMNLANLLDDHFADQAGALALYQKALEICPTEPMIHFNLGILNKRLENYEEARKNQEEAIRLKPYYVNALCALAYLLNYHLNEPELSLKYYGLALEHAPGDTEILCEMAEAYENQEAYTEARDLYNKVLEIEPNDVNALIGLANLIDDEFPDKETAATLYQKALEIDDENPSTHFNYGLYLKRTGKYGEAKKQYLLAIEKDPEYIDAYCNLASLLAWQLEDFDLSKDYCHKAMALNPGTNEILKYIIPILKKCSQYDEARLQYEKLLESEPDNVTALIGIGDLIDDNFPDKDTAKLYYHRAIALEPENAKAFFYLGYLHKNLEEYDEARKNYEEAYKLDPEYENVVSNLAYLFSKHYKDYPSAIVWFEKYLGLAPDDYDTRRDMGDALENVGRNDEAKKQYEIILAAEPDNYLAHISMGFLLDGHYNEYGKAKAHFLRAIEIDPKNPVAYHDLALICSLNNEPRHAKKYYEHALQCDPNYEISLENLAELLVDYYKKYDVAITYYERYLVLKPDNNEARTKLCEALYYCGRYAQAEEQFEIIKKNDPENSELHERLGELLEKPMPGLFKWLNNLVKKLKGWF